MNPAYGTSGRMIDFPQSLPETMTVTETPAPHAVATPAEAAPSSLPEAPPSLWRDRNFAAFWSAQTISQFGVQVGHLAMPVTLWIGAAGCFLAAAPVLFSPLWSLRRLPDSYEG
jgi:hypothetical protein